jgi:TM2 domain-containing membrane protein YozV
MPPKPSDKTTPPKANPALAGLLAWLVPGAGHLYLDRPVRAAVLFIVIQGLFWSGVAVGGVFTINPRQEVWWTRAQLLTGLGGVVSYQRQKTRYNEYFRAILHDEPRLTQPQRDAAVDELLARDHLALVQPTSGVAYVLSGVAGMLNLMCIFDAVMLALLGQMGEPAEAAQEGQASATPAAPKGVS